jgi:hypothetical protein
MRRLTLATAVVAFVGLSFGDSAIAQLIQIGPSGDVRVRAPFTRVYVGPNGETSVRAPFTSVDTPGRYPRELRYVIPYFPYAIDDGYYDGRRTSRPRDDRYVEAQSRPPTPEELAAMDWASVGAVIRTAALRLSAVLDQRSNGAHWKNELQLARLVALVPEANEPPDPETVVLLSEIAGAHEAIASDRDFRRLGRLEDFDVLEAALVEYLSPPLDRTRRQLIGYSELLQERVARFSTGAQWQAHLKLPLEPMPEGYDPALAPPPDAAARFERERTALVKTVARYESVATDARYKIIADLPEFQATHDLLVAYVTMLPQAPPAVEPPEGPVEVLPPPKS